MSLGHVDLLWLVAGVVLHLSSQLARGRGWHSVVCAAHPGQAHIPPGLIRMSVGCEDVEDVWADLDAALRS